MSRIGLPGQAGWRCLTRALVGYNYGVTLPSWLKRAEPTKPVTLLQFWVALTGVIIAGIALFASAAVLLWLGLDRPDLGTGMPLEPKDQLDLVRIALIVTGGMGGLVALVVAYRKQRIAEDANRRAETEIRWAEEANHRAIEAGQRDVTKLFNERYASASAQLGHDAAAVRLAGVYALAGLADDWEAGRQTCIDVLCAYMRMPYQPDQQQPDWVKGEREVRLSLIRVVRDHLLDPGDYRSWCGRDFDFTGATFDGGDFGGAHFSDGTVIFASAKFIGGDVGFYEAEFSGGTVRFDEAEFSGGTVRFYTAKFSGGTVRFDEAKFSGGTVRFDRAQFSGGTISFDEAEFSEGRVAFNRAQFSGGTVSFDEAQFSGGRVAFDDAQFSGGTVAFNEAQFSGGMVAFNRADFSGGTVAYDAALFFGGTVEFNLAHFSGGTVRFDRSEFSAGAVALGGAQFSAGIVAFDSALFSGGSAWFRAAQFHGGMVAFDRAKFSAGMVAFDKAQFSGGTLSFNGAHFSGGSVGFDEAEFSGGTVRFDTAELSDLLLPLGSAAAMPSSGPPAAAPEVIQNNSHRQAQPSGDSEAL
ncbi:hypothetical protein GCM10028775_46680 [Catellatospora paridis]